MIFNAMAIPNAALTDVENLVLLLQLLVVLTATNHVVQTVVVVSVADAVTLWNDAILPLVFAFSAAIKLTESAIFNFCVSE
jgi:hypothetical protein